MYTPIKLDKTRNVLLGFEALQLFKKITGKSLLKIDLQNEDIEDLIPIVFYAGLVHEDNELTLEKVTGLLDKHLGIKGTVKAFWEVVKELQMEDDGEEKN